MRYYEIRRNDEGLYKVMIYTVLFSFLFPVFTAYTGSTKEVNAMLMYYKNSTGTMLKTVHSYKAGA